MKVTKCWICYEKKKCNTWTCLTCNSFYLVLCNECKTENKQNFLASTFEREHDENEHGSVNIV